MDILEIVQTIENETCDNYKREFSEPYNDSDPYFLEGLDPQHLNLLTKIIRNIKDADKLKDVKSVRKLIRELKEYAGYSCDTYIDYLKKEGSIISGIYEIDNAIKDYHDAEQNLIRLVRLLYKLA